MSMTSWQAAYELGHAEIDADHRRILAIIEDLTEATAADAFARLGDEVLGHFAREERLMAELGYPQLDQHRDEHRRLERDFHRFRDAFLAGPEGPARARRLVVLASWWISHIVRADMQLIPLLRHRRS